MTPSVLIPGLNNTAELFLPQIAALWSYGPVTVASTLEGETIAEMAAAILRDAPPRFALAGFSMGGYIAFEIMRRAPERVLKLTLIDTSARPDRRDQALARRIGLKMMETGDPVRLHAEAEKRLLHPDHWGDAGFRDMRERASALLGVSGARRQQEAIIARPDSRPGLGSIAVPTLVLVGDADATTPPELSEEMAAAIPGARLVVVEKSGHMTPYEQPEAVNRALIEWIAG